MGPTHDPWVAVWGTVCVSHGFTALVLGTALPAVLYNSQQQSARCAQC